MKNLVSHLHARFSTLSIHSAVLMSLCAALFVTAPAVYAGRDKAMQANETVILSRSETINETYFASGDTVIISGTINGDAYITGGSIEIDGVINGDLLVAGGTIRIDGDISDDIRVAGGQITIDGRVGKNVTAAGGMITFSESAIIEGGVVAAGGNLIFEAPVTNNIYVGGGSVSIKNQVGGDVMAGVGTLTLGSRSIIGGDLTYWSDEPIIQQSGAQIAGSIEQKEQSHKKDSSKAMKYDKNDDKEAQALGFFAGIAVVGLLLKIVSSTIVGLLMLRFLPIFTKQAVEAVENKPWLTLGIGFLTLIVTPIAALILMATVVGLPLGLIALAAYGVGVYLSHIIVSLLIGQKVFAYSKKKVATAWALITGIIIVTIVGALPVIGGLAKFAILLFGLGALVLTEKHVYEQVKEKKLI